MEFFGFWGFIAFIMVASSSLPGKVKSLERKVKNLNNKIKGENTMSKLLEELIGKKCKMKIDGEVEMTGVILSVDEDWLKMDVERNSFEKYKEKKTRLFKIENINSFELVEDDFKK